MTNHRPTSCETAQTMPETVEISQEYLSLSKEKIATGKIRIKTQIEAVEKMVRSDLEHQDVEVKRIPVDRIITAWPDIRTEGDCTIIPIVEEVLFVEKRLVLKEEVHLRRKMRNEHIDMPIVLRKQHAVVEHIDLDDSIKSERTHDEHDG